MAALTTCVRCSYIDYKDVSILKCPKCGSSVHRLENPFIDETIIVKVMDMDRKTKDVDISFVDMEKAFYGIIGKDLGKVIEDNETRLKVEHMVKVYVWMLLKAQPQLWLSLDLVASGIKELMMLRLTKKEESR